MLRASDRCPWPPKMHDKLPQTPQLLRRLTRGRHGPAIQILQRCELTTLALGAGALLIHAGFVGVSEKRVGGLSLIVFSAAALLSFMRLIVFFLTAKKQKRAATIASSGLLAPFLWVGGMLLLWLTGQNRFILIWTEVVLAIAIAVKVLYGSRLLVARSHNSAVLLVASFLITITFGTLLLQLPVCRATTSDGEIQPAASWDIALFTATSAACVTGLVVEPTGSYWSTYGHVVIFVLFQIGGLGILTFGAFLAVLSGRRGLQFSEARNLREMLDAETLQGSRRLLLTILLFTLTVEALGAVALSGLWSHLPLAERIWNSVFHAVSAFCNAGFSLQDSGFQDMGMRWQIWGPLTTLIILGGLGFPVVRDLAVWFKVRFAHSEGTPLFRTSAARPNLSLHSSLVLYTTAALLFVGALGWFALESLEAGPTNSIRQRTADAWFQSVTFRTAGFNTVDHATMHPATKLLAIFLMFIGAAPGSTGGGIKTVVFAVTVLNVRAVFRSRPHVEVWGRRLPASQVSRALAMIGVGMLVVMMTAGLLVIFERQPELFIDHLFEATSAFATVGVSAGMTPNLTMPSRMVICVVMFLGRVGPITLLLAMATSAEHAEYDYPEERVSLG